MLYHNSVSNLRVGLYGSYSTLSPVVHGDIALSINTKQKKQNKKKTKNTQVVVWVFTNNCFV